MICQMEVFHVSDLLSTDKHWRRRSSLSDGSIRRARSVQDDLQGQNREPHRGAHTHSAAVALSG
jgi:hypothetical protein